MKKINYLETEIDWQEDILMEQHQEFDEYWRTWCAENDIDPPNFEQPQKPQQTNDNPAELEEQPT